MPTSGHHDAVSYPAPQIISPHNDHTHTLILLHGRGQDGLNFGSELITTQLTHEPHTLPQRFPGLKFIFPNAKLRPSSAHNGSHLPQWFDIKTLDPPWEGRCSQREGLRESIAYITGIIEDEINLVGASNVIIGGLSQGCAQALMVLLTYDDGGRGKLGGLVGLSGILPFQPDLARLIGDGTQEEHDNYGDDTEATSSIQDGEREQARLSLAATTVNFAREHILSMPPIEAERTAGSASTPIWLAHGSMDPLIKIEYAQEGAETLKALGWDVSFMVYDDLDHWYTSYELDDLAIFLSTTAGVPELSEL
ncbi:hypothetical protein AJ80_05901 [Polytolypa hystricis UAMH7299]|uniref:Phospholipase/carboxylesterase/thioesterase domain-containing protein n=1 Tax=Polytolypa hystricis (strain UAMH7299) TaxID=1447883 RepID=A0A2B7XZ21_POLH7|nr:hypothetical protein AJ80_05901 [Polytolypa hystricis UAMH7299]